MRADVVIVNWNTGELLRECLASLAAFPEGVGQVIVVDNGSVDGSADLSSVPSNVTVIKTGENLGFARGCNLGASCTTAPYVLFLNPDAQLLQDGLPRALKFMESPEGKAFGICGVQMVDDDGEVQRSCTVFPGVAVFFGQATGLNRVLPSVFPTLFMETFDHLSSRSVDVVIGAYFLVRRDVFESLYFDERFFVYFDEVDFCLRARALGQATYYLAEAQAYHKGGGSTDQVRAHRLFYALRSRLLFAFKHFDGASAWAIAGITFGIESVTRSLQALITRRSLADVRHTIRAYRMLWQDMPKIKQTIARLRPEDRTHRRRLHGF
jgi:GT2 family glycosyltransferase